MTAGNRRRKTGPKKVATKRTTGENRPRRRTTGTNRSAAKSGGGHGMLIAIAVLVAAGIAFHKPILNKIQGEQAAPAATSTKAASSASVRAADRELKEQLKQANQFLKKGEYEKAELLLDGAVSLKGSEELVKKAQGQLNLVRFLSSVAAINPSSPEAQGQWLYDFRLKSGDKFRALVLSEDLENVTVLKGDGAELTLARTDVTSQEPVSARQRQHELKTELKSRLPQTDKTAQSFWRLACFAFRSNLDQEGTGFIQKAWKMDANLPKKVYNESAQLILKDWIYYRSISESERAQECYGLLKKNYRKSPAYKTASELLNEEKKYQKSQKAAAVAAQTPTAAPPATAQVVAAGSTPAATATAAPVQRITGSPANRQAVQANNAFVRGMRLFNAGAVNPDATKGREMINKALEKMNEAEKLYNALLEKDGGNNFYKARLKEVQRKKFWASRFRRLS